MFRIVWDGDNPPCIVDVRYYKGNAYLDNIFYFDVNHAEEDLKTRYNLVWATHLQNALSMLTWDGDKV